MTGKTGRHPVDIIAKVQSMELDMNHDRLVPAAAGRRLHGAGRLHWLAVGYLGEFASPG